MKNKYDYLIVGAGLFGSIFAYEMTKRGKTCLVIDKRSHIGGNCYTEKRDNINVHVYGPHIFHTNNEIVWGWINEFITFLPYKHTAKVSHGEDIFSFPINLMTLHQLWGVKTPNEAEEKLKSVRVINDNPANLEEWALSQVGHEIYNKFIKGYTEKQWGKSPKNLPSDIIKRLPIRLNFNDCYFFDKYQGIPTNGYTELFEKLLSGIDILINSDYINIKDEINYDKLVYTGKIDEYFNYKFGDLEYRGLTFKTKRLNMKDYQGSPVVNYTEKNVPFTRITEHKHFENSISDVTWITKEFSSKCERKDIPYYPINDEENNNKYQKYLDLSKSENNVIFGGRLGEYKYYDMDKIIESALNAVKKEIDDVNN